VALGKGVGEWMSYEAAGWQADTAKYEFPFQLCPACDAAAQKAKRQRGSFALCADYRSKYDEATKAAGAGK